MCNFRFIILAVLASLVGCSNAAVMTISNRSGVAISNVVVSGSGFSEHIGDIASDTDYKLKVNPKGESGVRLVFDARGQHVDTGETGYFENGYHISVVVTQDMKVVVQPQLSKY